MPKDKSKAPKIKNEPHKKLTPVIGTQFISDDRGPVFWSFSLIDCSGPWGFDVICKNEFHNLITSGFKSKEGISWEELKRNGGSHSINFSCIVKKARKRLEEIHLEDVGEQLFSMRFTGEKRVWGIRHGNVFKVLWWDPKHEICPSPKKHT